MNFDLSEGDLVQQHELFNQVCAQNINTLDSSDEIFLEQFQPYIDKKKKNNKRHDAYNSDSDEDLSPTDAEILDTDRE